MLYMMMRTLLLIDVFASTNGCTGNVICVFNSINYVWYFNTTLIRNLASWHKSKMGTRFVSLSFFHTALSISKQHEFPSDSLKIAPIGAFLVSIERYNSPLSNHAKIAKFGAFVAILGAHRVPYTHFHFEPYPTVLQ